MSEYCSLTIIIIYIIIKPIKVKSVVEGDEYGTVKSCD